MNNKRMLVHQKYGGKCAYCGISLDFGDMQIDHLIPKAFGGSDGMDNLMPSCRKCNYYKSGNPLEVFRGELKKVTGRMQKTFLSKLARQYNMVTYHSWDGLFYYERKLAKLQEEIKKSKEKIGGNK